MRSNVRCFHQYTRKGITWKQNPHNMWFSQENQGVLLENTGDFESWAKKIPVRIQLIEQLGSFHNFIKLLILNSFFAFHLI